MIEDNFGHIGEGIRLARFLSFKTDEIHYQFYNQTDARLHSILSAVLFCITHEIRLVLKDKSITVTDAVRSWEVQDRIYGHDHKDLSVQAKYKARPWASVHMYSPTRAIDIVIPSLSKEGEDKIEKFIEAFFPYGDGIHKSILFHSVSGGRHAHLQVSLNESLHRFVDGKSKYV